MDAKSEIITGLNARQERALAALLSEVTIEAAAKKAGISTVTMWRHLQTPAFRAAYLQTRRQLVEETTSLLQRASKKAVSVLIRNLDCGVPSVEVASARVVLDSAYRGVEQIEMEERVRQLEEFQQEEQERKP